VKLKLNIKIQYISDLNKKVSYNYIIKKKYTSGIVLLGWEVKCIRFNGIQISGCFVKIKHSELWLINSFISSSNFVFAYINIFEHRDRKLLLRKSEIKTIEKLIKIKGHTIIPVRVYWINNFIKIDIAVCIGKKLYEKNNNEKYKIYDPDFI
jgi:SsrA-binding protein